jgi:two-component system, cell cycle response regulator
MKILVSVHDERARRTLENHLSGWEHEVVFAEDGSHALRLTTAQSFEVAILDWQMRGVGAVEACRAIRARQTTRPPYILLLTGVTASEDLDAGLDAGADDFLKSPCDAAELAARLRGAQRLFRAQDNLARAREVIAYQAANDVATGMLNRSTILTRVHALFLERQGQALPVSLVRVEIQAHLLDRPGRVADALLRAMANRIRTAAPSDSWVGRGGPYEILVVLPWADPAVAERVAENIDACLADEPFALNGSQLMVPTTTTCVTASRPDELDEGWMFGALEADSSVRPRNSAVFGRALDPAPAHL